MRRHLTIITATAAAVTLTAGPAEACTRLQWADRTLLRIEGGECEQNGKLSATRNVWIVPTLVRDGRTWVAGENVEVRTLIDRGGQPCT